MNFTAKFDNLNVIAVEPYDDDFSVILFDNAKKILIRLPADDYADHYDTFLSDKLEYVLENENWGGTSALTFTGDMEDEDISFKHGRKNITAKLFNAKRATVNTK